MGLERGGTAVGESGPQRADIAEIESLAVREDLHLKGIGYRLVSAYLDEARRLGLTRVFRSARAVRRGPQWSSSRVDPAHRGPHRGVRRAIPAAGTGPNGAVWPGSVGASPRTSCSRRQERRERGTRCLSLRLPPARASASRSSTPSTSTSWTGTARGGPALRTSASR
ncbi:MAG: hypothetical protein C4290_08595 [Chloroflexota bacterium]